MSRYRICGLVIESDFPLTASPVQDEQTEADIVVNFAGTREVPSDVIPEGQRLQAVQYPEQLLYTTVRRSDGAIYLRLHGAADFLIAPDLRYVTAWNDPAYGMEALALLTTGNLLATVLMLRGEAVLHASAVERHGRALAFVADSGMGKSTLAALCCDRGARFLADDVLRLDFSDQGVRVWQGASENRLRRSTEELGLVPQAHRQSWDGRFVWSPPPATSSVTSLAAVVLPVLTREVTPLEMERLSPSVAVMELAQHPRLLGWEDHEGIVTTFNTLSRLAAAVPVFTATIPWGPPFDLDMIDELLAIAGGKLAQGEPGQM